MQAHTRVQTHTHTGLAYHLRAPSLPPEAPKRTEPTKLGFRYQRCNTPTWPLQWCIPRELIVKSQTLPLVYRLTRPQRHTFYARMELTLRTAATFVLTPPQPYYFMTLLQEERVLRLKNTTKNTFKHNSTFLPKCLCDNILIV